MIYAIIISNNLFQHKNYLIRNFISSIIISECELCWIKDSNIPLFSKENYYSQLFLSFLQQFSIETKDSGKYNQEDFSY